MRPMLHTHFWPPRGTAAQRWALQSRGTWLNLEVRAAATTASSAPSGSIPEELAWMPNSAELSSHSSHPPPFFFFLLQYDFSLPTPRKLLLHVTPPTPPPSLYAAFPLLLYLLSYFFFRVIRSSCSQSNPSNSVNLIFWIWSHRWSPLLALDNFFSFSLTDFFFLMLGVPQRACTLPLLFYITLIKAKWLVLIRFGERLVQIWCNKNISGSFMGVALISYIIHAP